MPDPSPAALRKLAPVLTKRWLSPDAWRIDVYEQLDGYMALRKALTADPDDLIALVKAAGLRGRGGAGFPAGLKWQFIPQNDGKPHYLVVNADEGEPGTCKDLPLMMADPHSLIEGIIIASYAIRANRAFIYIRGEAVHAARRLRNAVSEATSLGYLGTDILGSGFDLDVVVHSGAGAYICGEETALLESLEGRRGQPRLRPPFPATHGLYASPTVVNNVETIASVPYIVLGGAAWFRSMGTEKSPGPKIYSVSGRVHRPGQYECSLGVTLGELIELAGGMAEGHQLKFWTPGGSSTPMLTAEHIHVPLDFEGMASVGTMLGTTAVQVFSDADDVVYATYRWIKFYHHESCGKCTPCREGNYWMVRILRRILSGAGRPEDLDLLLDTCGNLLGRSFCALGDGATSPVTSSIKYFRQDYLDYIEGRREPIFQDAAASGSSSEATDAEAELAGAR
ncbi:MAG: NADH-quinone oxidoreductase subunit NuoF [Dactylosporangium sp.]|nr:NADH-quinone oxidoreductase subunit NuoF [Dactylosporangium sp.]NNJ62470.1 NADH-quinone oxidoreductase subunit NuoF [Dactylosporangium sp.]